MADDRGNVPLPDEVTLSLSAVTELFGAIEEALAALDATHPDSPASQRLETALSTVSAELIDRLGFFRDDE